MYNDYMSAKNNNKKMEGREKTITFYQQRL
jgi:hypothetical protein